MQARDAAQGLTASGAPIQHHQQRHHYQPQHRLSTSSAGMPGLSGPGRDLLAAAAAAANGHSDEGSGDDLDDDHDSPDGHSSRLGKRKRPISVSCECCKQRKVKCDRGQPSCGWCKRNGVFCEYRERKKPGLRAGYGRELEQRLDKLEEILRSHSEIIQTTLSAYAGSSAAHNDHHHPQHPAAPPSVRTSNTSLPSDHGTPRDTSMFRPPTGGMTGDPMRTPQAETALFLQKPSSYAQATQAMDFGMPSIHSSHDSLPSHLSIAGVSPTSHMGSLQPSAATHEYYGTGHSAHQQQQQPQQQALSSSGITIPPGQSQISADQDLPPYDLLYALTDLYFKHINTWCPILHRKSTLDSLFGPSTLDETDRVLLYAIVATTLRYSTDPRLTSERRQHYHTISKQKVILYGMEHSSVKSLQALVILALDLCGDSNGPPGWNIMALITRSVVQLGLAVESTSFMVSPNFTSIYTLRAMILPESKDFIEDESRRRLFWMVYLLDRYATLATAFDFALEDKEIDRTLPCRDDLWIKNQKVETRWFHYEGDLSDQPDHNTNKPENLGAFSYYIEILGILARIHKFLKQPVDISALSDVEQWQLRYKELDQLMTSWKFGLPGEYGNMAKLFQPGFSKTLSCAWVMLHATYHTAVMRLHSSAAYPTTRSPIFTPSYSASQRCHGAVENVVALAEVVVQSNMLHKLGPPFAFTLWVSARLLLVHGSTVEHTVSPRIAFLVDTLREMGRYWPVADRYCRLLQRVLDEHNDFEASVNSPSAHGKSAGNVTHNNRGMGGSGAAGDSRDTPSSVKILADMRRTAFDLDFLISRQPRHIAGAPSRLPSVTPVRTPASAELEYLDVFDFFNVPRLPFGGNGHGNGEHSSSANNNGANGNGVAADGEDAAGLDGIAEAPSSGGNDGKNQTSGSLANEFNIVNFTMDVESDWFKQQP
ncbi:fungal-specific transcription factor domain-containing protein [Microdochium trichocladiopsis]|uniref:Fungal-specific transcription factor domain-containing protein n=1 Tax=Microdochium trichocladiopsis TaxID=1682393 RepID=A0A9P9BQE4_9PEZI|nr:fungal-specific transcription factor domain-containing protein [Microdochium trichocladiopsis]KAH7030785.1 fungal-specific transcription factor domain-containing protein [Microdochium trichocladiopsis]